jgi:tripartite-type tricarboxylate transporter receptor subunit TctC
MDNRRKPAVARGAGALAAPGWKRGLRFARNCARFARILVAALVAAAAMGQAALAQDAWPSKPIRIITPYSAGGLGEQLPRMLAQALAKRLGQQVLVEARPGASQIIGAQAAASAAPDGYTLFFASTTNMVINSMAHKKLPYDPVRDFAPIGICCTAPLYLLVNPKLPFKNVRELLVYARANPGKLTFASGGNGSTNHLAGEMLMSQAGVSMVHIPYKGAGPAISDLMGGQVDLMFEGNGLEYARAGRLRALAIGSLERSKAAPEIPTMREFDLPNFEVGVWFGLAAPAATPRAIVERLSREMLAALAEPELRAQLAHVTVTPADAAQMAARIQSDTVKWRRVIQDGQIKFD